MDPIDGSRRSLDQIRRQLAERMQQLRQADPGKEAKSPAPRSTPPAPALRDTVIRRMKAIPKDDERHFEKSVGIFVEAVLLSEFGQGLVNNPEFREMTQEVERMMMEDPLLKTKLGELTRHLLQSETS